MKMRYWKVICRYGHVGRRNEVSVARFIETEYDKDITYVWDLVSNMPGIKSRGVSLVEPIDYETYQQGKKAETENLYLQKLMTFNLRPSCSKNSISA